MFKKFLRALNQHLEEYLIALFLIAITFVMLLQIVMRYVCRTHPQRLFLQCAHQSCGLRLLCFNSFFLWGI